MTLEVNSLSFSYGNKRIFGDVSFSVNGGGILAVLGPNGAGKTTLLRVITGLLKKQSGVCLYDGEDISKMSEKKLWSRISYVPQSAKGMAAYSVLDSVLFGLAGKIGVFSSPGKKEIGHAESILDELGISHLRDRRMSEISGGEAQMVLIARALVSDPGLILLDEPETGLDFYNQLKVLGTLSSLASRGIACIFNTHYPDHALNYADKSILLYDAHATVGATETVLTAENIKKAFGVNVILNNVTTPDGAFRSIIPVSIADDDRACGVK